MIKRDATMLLRPKTGLKDMVIELDPGTQGAPAVPDGYTIPVSQTRARRQPRRDPRQPRPRHARLPAAAGRRRRRGPEGQRAATSRNAFRRFEPLNRDVAKLTRQLAQAAQEPRAADPQPPAAVTEVGTQGQGAGRAGRLPERGVRGVRQPGREPARDVPAAARTRCETTQRGARQVRRSSTDAARSDAARAAPGRAGARRRAARDAGRSRARRSRRSRTRSGRSRARRSRPSKALQPGAQRPGEGHARPRRRPSTSSTSSSTRSPTTRRAPQRATCSRRCG